MNHSLITSVYGASCYNFIEERFSGIAQDITSSFGDCLCSDSLGLLSNFSGNETRDLGVPLYLVYH